MINSKFKIRLLPNGRYIIKKRNFIFLYETLKRLEVPVHIVNAPSIMAFSECYYEVIEFNTIEDAEKYIKTEYYGK